MRYALASVQSSLAALGDPQQAFPAVHIAGSNGKGTTAALLANAFTLSGVRCGLFTSPHLCYVEERIRIDGEAISPTTFDAALGQIRSIDQGLTFYEVTFLAAMLIFAESGVERAVIETGLGGRLDATRCVEADACILTSLSLEHSNVLGNTLEDIATEKAAIARPGVPLISVHGDVDATIEGFSDSITWVEPNLSGYRQEAADLARACAESLGRKDVAMRVDLERLNWPGRHQVLNYRGTQLHLEGAHNPCGVARFVAEMDPSTFDAIVLGTTPQEDLSSCFTPLLEAKGNAAVVLTVPQGGRHPGVGLPELMAAFSPVPIHAMHPDPMQALEIALRSGPRVLIIGSLYLIGNILAEIDPPGSILKPTQ